MSIHDESQTLLDLAKPCGFSSKADTPMQQFYRGANIFITGGSGFMGKVLIEKILRCFPHVGNIYLLIREKRGCSVEERMNVIFNNELFSKLAVMSPQYRSKVHAVTGDCSMPGLGLSEDERHLLTRNVDIVFHGAATVRFDESLRLAVAINVNGTKNVLLLAKQMKKLKAIVHLSTAYSNCPCPEIDEVFYDPPMSLETMTNLLNSTSDEQLDRVINVVLGKWPNTYSLTKAMAEDLIRKEGRELPIVVFRPSIVVSIKDDPLPGWAGNLYGPAGLALGAGVGLIKSVHCDPDVIADKVPVDMVINAMLAAAWDLGNNTIHTTAENITIYNYVSSPQNPMSYGDYNSLLNYNWLAIPTMQSHWYYSIRLNKLYWIHWLYIMMSHFLPALVVDTVSILRRKKPMLWNIFTKISKINDALTYFTMNSWKFSNDNVQALWLKLSEEDKNNFLFDMKQLNWSDYVYDYAKGLRVYLLKEDMSTVPQALERQRRLYWIHQATKSVMVLIVLCSTWHVFSWIVPL